MDITCLPGEVLLLVLANLRTQDVRSLALTFNKNIIAVCVKFLQPLCVQIRNEKDMAHRFRYRDLSKTDFVDPRALQRREEGRSIVWWIDAWGQHREGLNGLWQEYIETWDILECAEAELPSLPADFTAGGALECTEYVTRDPRPSTLLTSDEIQTFSNKATSLNVKIPPGFWKAMSDEETIRAMTLAGDSYIEVKSFELCHTRITKPQVGYLLPFMHDPDKQECSWYLYLEPGPEYRCCVLRIFDVLKTTNIDDEFMWDILSEAITADDRRIADERDVRLYLMDSTNIGIAGFCFRDWIAHRLFNQWLEAEPNITDALAKAQKRAGQGMAGIKSIQQSTELKSRLNSTGAEKVQDSTDSGRKRCSGLLARVFRR